MKQEKGTIEALLEAEELPHLPEQSQELRKIELKPSPESLSGPKINWEERREFTRASVDTQIVLNFSNETQFAKHYVENISLGGLFVKTNHRPGMGAVVPIEFAVKMGRNEKLFRLHGKVCRQTDRGLGLEFTNLTPETRKELEVFVKSSLPEGASIVNQVKKTTVDRLEQTREEKKLREAKQLKAFKASLAIAVLIGLNIYLANEVIETETITQTGDIHQQIQLGNQSIPVENIRSFSKSEDGKILLQLNEGQSLEIPIDQLQTRDLPADLQQSLTLIQTIPPEKTIRKTKNPSRSSTSISVSD